MADNEHPEGEEKDTESADEAERSDLDLFGIDLGRRGDKVEQKSRDAVDVPTPKKEKAATRTLTERLASAAAERDDSADAPEPPPKDEPPEPEETE